jgi:hypothetical protein
MTENEETSEVKKPNEVEEIIVNTPIKVPNTNVETIKESLDLNSNLSREEQIKQTLMVSSPSASLVSNDSLEVIIQTAQALEHMQKLGEVLVKSALCPIRKAEDVVLAILTGNQYGFHYMVSVNNIFPINGKPTLSAHLQRALLIKHNIVFEKIHNYEPVYQFLKVDKEGNFIKITQDGKEVPIVVARGTIHDSFPDAKIYMNKVVDYITTYTFKRLVKLGNTTEIIKAKSSFTMSEAVQAGLAEKDNYIKYPARMLDARAFTTGAREIAPDVTLGVYSISELADANNIPYTINDNLEEVIIQQ